MIRSILTLCCLGLLVAVIAAAVPGTNGRFPDTANAGLDGLSFRSGSPPAGDRYLDRQHSLPLWADADETDDTEELSGREKGTAAHHARQRPEAGPSPRTTRFEAAIQRRLANTLNALGVRLQI